MTIPDLTWSQVALPRGLDLTDLHGLLEHLASARALGPLVFEARSDGGAIAYFIGTDSATHRTTLELLREHLPGSQTLPVETERPRLDAAVELRATPLALPHRTDDLHAPLRAMLRALASTKKQETLLLQVALGPRRRPETTDSRIAPYMNPLRALIGTPPPELASKERTRLAAKRAVHGFRGAVRLGAAGAGKGRPQALLSALVGGLRTLEAPGAPLRVRAVSLRAVHEARVPNDIVGRGIELSTLEIAPLLAYPLGDRDYPGQPPAHPKRPSPPKRMKHARHPFAISTGLGREVRVGLGGQDALFHMLLLGRTGSGKSVLMSHLILDAIEQGRGVLVIDPKGDLIAQELLPRIPADRREDVVVIDPMSDLPVGINPFAEAGAGRASELVADSLLAVFKAIYKDSWGPRLEDILSSALLTLARTEGATLAMLPALLTDPVLRRRLTANLRDPVGLEPFWKSYEAMSPEQRAQVIAPVLNKMRPYLTRSGLRRTLGQAHPRFTLSDLFTKKRIVLVNLNKGMLGEGSRLLGALIVSQLWPLILARTAVPQQKRHIVHVFIDEVQDYLALPTDLADAFAQARGLGVSFTVAHQYRKQLPPALLAGLDTNARSTAVFGLDHTDAADLAKRAPNLDAEDFMALGRYEAYLNLMDSGEATGWFSARTLGPTEPISDPAVLLRESLARYGTPALDVDREIQEALGLGAPDPADDRPLGRRKRGGEG